MTGKYDWRPGQGVRSVAEVFNLIVGENKMLAGILTGAPAAGGRGNPVTDPGGAAGGAAQFLRRRRSRARGPFRRRPESAGQDLRARHHEQGAALMLLMDQHEHLGKSIAYARSNGVVPPWSK